MHSVNTFENLCLHATNTLNSSSLLIVPLHTHTHDKNLYMKEIKEQKTTFPLGQEPLLVSKFGFLKKEELFPILSFVIEDKHTLNIPTPLPLLKSILEVLDKTQAKAGWNIVKQVRKVDHPLTKTSISKNKLH